MKLFRILACSLLLNTACGAIKSPVVVPPTPVPTTRWFQVTVRALDSAVLVGAHISLCDEVAVTEASGRAIIPALSVDSHRCQLTVWADHFRISDESIAVPDGNVDWPDINLSPDRVQPQTLAPLPALPICGSCPSPYSYDKTLPWAPPADPAFIRADFAGVPIPGLPFVTGGSREHPERILTGFLYKYDRDVWWQTIFDAHAIRGYTHFILWWPNARNDGLSVQQFTDMACAVQQAGFHAQIGLVSKDFDPQDQSPDQWRARLAPIMDALNAAHCADEYAVWEWDSFNIPGQPTLDTLKWIGQQAHAAGATFWIHFLPGHTSWFADGDTRGRYGFYSDLGSDIDGLQYQSNPAWDVGELQSRLVDTLIQFANQGNVHKLRLFETTASSTFSGDHPNEGEADLYNLLGICTVGPARVWGFGNGARWFDGTPVPGVH